MRLSKQEYAALEGIVRKLEDFNNAIKDLNYLGVHIDKERTKDIIKLKEVIESKDYKKIRDYLKNSSNFLLEVEKLTNETFSRLTPYQQFKLSRHPQRPKSSDYIKAIFDDFTELGGNNEVNPDHSIVGGIARLGKKNFVVIGQEKGVIGYDAHYREGGVVKPAGYRKSQRLMDLAEKLNFPLITFIDTPGANPIKESIAGQSIEASINGRKIILGKEEKEFELQINDHPHNVKMNIEGLLTDTQGQTISRTIRKMGKLSVPTISIIIGEGGSGGAVAIGAADRLLMLKNSYFSVISPEGACGILKKYENGERVKLDPNNKEDLEYVSKNLKFSALDCLNFGIIDGMIEEPLYGAHNSSKEVYTSVKDAILQHLISIRLPSEKKELIKERLEKYRKIVKFSEGKEKNFSKNFKKEFSSSKEEAEKWISCPNSQKEGCKDLHPKTLYVKYQGVCPSCDYHFRMPLEFYLGNILEHFQEKESRLESINSIGFEGFEKSLEEAKIKSGTNSALIYGNAKIGGKDIIAILSQNDFRGGSFGSAESEKIVRAFSRAIEYKEKGKLVPVVMFNSGGGIRIEEGPIGVSQMITSSQACSLLEEEGIPLISVLLDPTMAGILASYAGNADFVIAEKNAMIGFAGEDVIKKTIGETVSKEFRYAEEAQKRGFVDLVVNRTELKNSLEKIIKLYD